MREPKTEHVDLNAAVIINTRCIEVMRAHKGTFRLSESEYALCDKLGWEIAKILPKGTKINPLHTISTEDILDWAEHGTSSKSLPNELVVAKKRIMMSRVHKLKRDLIKDAIEVLFFAGCSIVFLWIIIHIMAWFS